MPARFPRSPRLPLRRPGVWSVLVAAMALVAGMLFATSARTARGTDLRSGRRLRLTELIEVERRRLAALDARARVLRRDVEAATQAAAQRDSGVRAAQAAGDALVGPAGLQPVRGPGLVVSLDDAPRLDGDGATGSGVQGDPAPDDLVVHEQDVHAVINALWAGGAEAVTVMGDRIVATSAVRCVGNTLLLHGAVYSPPFVVAAIGSPETMQRSLDRSPGVALFRSYVAAYGLGYQVERRERIDMPAYTGSVQLRHAGAGTGR